MALKNAYSKKPIQNIFNDIEKTLVKHGASQVVREYDGAGKAIGITFVVKVSQDRFIPVKLPARFREVRQVLAEQGFHYDDEQAYRVAWRNIEDWISAQMTIIELGMVKLQEVFLPYMTDRSGETYFERFEKKNLLPGEGGSHE